MTLDSRLFTLDFLVRLFFHRGEHLRERAQLVGRESAGDSFFERVEVTMHARSDLTAAGRQLDDEGPPIRRTDVARDEPALGEPIEDARERRALMREAPVQARDGRRSGGRQMREDVRLALRNAELSDVEPDPVRRAMDGWNEAQGHQR